MHQSVYLQLRLVERVLRRGDHVAVDDLADPGIEAYLKGLEIAIEDQLIQLINYNDVSLFNFLVHVKNTNK
jgi:hypothetical protein